MKADIFNSLKNQIKTGDIIAFDGKGFVSGLIKLITRSQYSHVGMAIWADLAHTGLPSLYIAESTTLDDLPDFTGEVRKGMQIVDLSKRISNYDGRAWLVPFVYPLTEQEKSIAINSLLKYHDMRTKYNTIGAIDAGINFKIFGHNFFHSKNNEVAQFCSQVVANVLEKVGRLTVTIDPAETRPVDIVNLPCFKKPIPLF